MTTEQLESDRDRLRHEIADLRSALLTKEEELTHVERILEIRTGRTAPSLTAPTRSHRKGRQSITTKDHYERFILNGREFRTTGELLDYLGVPHYTSKIRRGRGDEPNREIVRWARKNPHDARNVIVVQKDGTRISLLDLIHKLWP